MYTSSRQPIEEVVFSQLWAKDFSVSGVGRHMLYEVSGQVWKNQVNNKTEEDIVDWRW